MVFQKQPGHTCLSYFRQVTAASSFIIVCFMIMHWGLDHYNSILLHMLNAEV